MNNELITYYSLNNKNKIIIQATPYKDYSINIYEDNIKLYSIYYPDKSLNYVKHEAEKMIRDLKRLYERRTNHINSINI